MKLTFIGLSCFLFENEAGYRLVIDPFEDAPDWTLGPKFPRKLDGKPFGSNLVLFSESDPDHSRRTFGWQQKAPAMKPGVVPFPGINLKGVVLQEYSGEPCVGWMFTIDGVRFLHLSDLPYPLADGQISEIREVDIIFVSPPKTHPDDEGAREFIDKIIESLEPRMVVWSHHIVPAGIENIGRGEIRDFMAGYLKDHASTNLNYKDENSFIELANILENAMILNKKYSGEISTRSTVELSMESISNLHKKPLLFMKMLSE